MLASKNIVTMYLERENILPVNFPHARTGSLYMNGLFIAKTLEPNYKKIPCGLYEVSWCGSPKFKGENRLLVFNDTTVPPSRGIRIHEGNSVEDSEGCILVGSDMKYLESGEPRLVRSKDAVKLLGTILDNIKPVCEKIVLVIG